MTVAELKNRIAEMRTLAKMEIEDIYKLRNYNPNTKRCTKQPTSVAEQNALVHKFEKDQVRPEAKFSKRLNSISDQLNKLVRRDKFATEKQQERQLGLIDSACRKVALSVSTAYDVTTSAVYKMTGRERAALDEANRRTIARIRHQNKNRPHETTNIETIDDEQEPTVFRPRRLKRAPPTDKQLAARAKVKLLPLERAIGIYVLKHIPSEKFYVGQSMNVYNRVMFSHFGVGSHLGAKCHNRYLSIDIVEDTIAAFELGCVEYCKSSELNNREMHWMKKLGTDYNLMEVDHNARNFIPSRETSERLSLAATLRAKRIAAEKKAGTRARFALGSYSEALWLRLSKSPISIAQIRMPKFCAPGYEDSSVESLTNFVKAVAARSYGKVKSTGSGEKKMFTFEPGKFT